MKYTFVLTILLIFFSCVRKEEKKFILTLPAYDSKIEFKRLNNFDTLLVWNWYNDNQADHRRCYRIQNSKLGIMLENGMSYDTSEYFDQMTIYTYISQDMFSSLPIRSWLLDKKELYLFERPRDKIFALDSIIINNRKFGVFGIERPHLGTKIIFMSNINNGLLEFEFSTNIHSPKKFHLNCLEMMKAARIKHYR